MAISSARDFFIQWHLTERCNLRCRHCYQGGRRHEEMGLSESFGVVQEVSDMLRDWNELYEIEFAPSASITGGEPFLREDLFEILDALDERGFDLHVLTNGTLVNRERAMALASMCVKGVQVSVEGPRDVHEAIRGAGSFDAALRGVGNLLDAGIRVTLNATLSEVNADAFGELVGLASRMGVQRVGFSRLVPSGRGLDMLPDALRKERIKKIYEEIFSLRTNDMEIVTGDPVALQLQCPDDNYGTIAIGGCAAGVSGLTLLPDGTVLPCRRLHKPIGNVLKDSVREIWATSEVLQALRDRGFYKGKCSKCSRWANCRGCRAVAHVATGDFLAEDPGCFIGEDS